MNFHSFEVPIAESMISLADNAEHPFQRFFSLWAAFNNIYTLLAKRLVEGGLLPLGERYIAQLVRKDSEVNFARRPEFWGYKFPKIMTPLEGKQIRAAVDNLDTNTKDELISHENLSFFVNRTPKGAPGDHDVLGQRINGVLNITRTVDVKYPVWSPITPDAYSRYRSGDHSDQELLAEQIVFLLYTIRNNLVHGSKRRDDSNDVEVVEKALPFLEMVVNSFIRN